MDHGTDADVTAFLRSLRRLARPCARVARSVAQRIAPPAPVDWSTAFAAYRSHAERIGLDRLHLFLSFDCDTDFDFAAVGPLHGFLEERGIAATYAVPGAQLLRGRAEYQELAARGGEFMNHGARPHAEIQGDRYVPITFYDQMTPAEIVEDIKRGHEIVRAVTGQTPIGFRAPHFGSFQRDQDLQFLYGTIRELGYRYASTTVPAKGLAYGPAYLRDGIVEFPTSGSSRYPETILDSWTYLTDRKDYALGDEYLSLFAETLERFVAAGMPGVLCWYADPSHVWQQAPFMKAMDLVARHRIPSLLGRDLLGLLEARLRAGAGSEF